MIRDLYEIGAIGNPMRDEDLEYLQNNGILKKEVKLSNSQLVMGTKRSTLDIEEALANESLKPMLEAKLPKGFFSTATLMVASRSFIDKLRELSVDFRRQMPLKSVEYVNTLRGDERIKKAQRKHARFINSTLVVSVTGSAASETLKHQQVVSGIGGQLDFVMMSDAMDDAKSVLVLHSTRGAGKNVESNIVFEYPSCSVPRQLRDVVITEYGIADLQGKRDDQCIIEMIQIADSRFQSKLIAEAKKYHKIAQDFELDPRYKNNTPEALKKKMSKMKDQGYFPVFPYGSELTNDEYELGTALRGFIVLLRDNKIKTLRGIMRNWYAKTPTKFMSHLERMGLAKPVGIKNRAYRAIVLYSLKQSRKGV